jgi:hypothetical protein
MGAASLSRETIESRIDSKVKKNEVTKKHASLSSNLNKIDLPDSEIKRVKKNKENVIVPKENKSTSSRTKETTDTKKTIKSRSKTSVMSTMKYRVIPEFRRDYRERNL